jgi:putative Holliday junction resolvase
VSSLEVPGRVLALDLGSRRIGVAVSDDGRRVASALTVLARSTTREQDHRAIAECISEVGANLVVVGLPLSLSGGSGPAASAVRAEVQELERALPVPVECCDERYSTVIAQRALANGGRRPAARRAVVDKVAAAAILQTWLDRQRAAANRRMSLQNDGWFTGGVSAGQ